MQKPSNLPSLARTAANWWRQVLDNKAPKDNGDAASSAAVNLLLRMDPSLYTADAPQLDRFEYELIRLIESQFDNLAEHQEVYEVDMVTDYGPEGILELAARKAQLQGLPFPFKTRMYLKKTGLFVSHGYGQPYVLLLACTYN
jgi:hypothetical protein